MDFSTHFTKYHSSVTETDSFNIDLKEYHELLDVLMKLTNILFESKIKDEYYK